MKKVVLTESNSTAFENLLHIAQIIRLSCGIFLILTQLFHIRLDMYLCRKVNFSNVSFPIDEMNYTIFEEILPSKEYPLKIELFQRAFLTISE